MRTTKQSKAGTQNVHKDFAAQVTAHRIVVSGRVQGVGFRPFIYRLATGQQLSGWVLNRVGQVEIHIQGPAAALAQFERLLIAQAPPLARPHIESSTTVDPADLTGFAIHASISAGAASIHVPPDLFTCDDCLRELNDPADRRYHYPFINCTQCGPRYTLIRDLPYDRPSTTMAGFELCPDCRKEYENPADRRFHAEPVACPVCGPALTFRTPAGNTVDGNDAALQACIDAIRTGSIVAIKGIGGYHLVCDAGNDNAIDTLRARKPRPHKPLAVMFPAPPAAPLAAVSKAVHLGNTQEELLLSAARPIVLAQQRDEGALSDRVAPGLDEIGVMLPYSPLHHLLLNACGVPLVATSANISGEPVLTNNREVEARLAHVADACLHHNRPIERPADDPVYRLIGNVPRPVRLGRGVAPLECDLPFTLAQPVIAVGGHMKNTVALAWDSRLVVSPHIGDMGNAHSLKVFEQTVTDLQSLYNVSATTVLCDAHPGYATSRWAEHCGLPVAKIFHHHAHASAAYTDDSDTDWLVFTWDGVGYGADGSLWGGEALLGRPGGWQRVASLRPFHLPGGERAGREPWRSAAALCWETATHWPELPANAGLLRHAWERRINTPQTSAAGRLFDAAAALTGLCQTASFEGQGPMLLEAASKTRGEPVAMPLTQDDAGLWLSDWAPLLPVLLDDRRSTVERAAVFHASMAHALLDQAQRIRESHGVTHIGLSGGVFQNRVLTELASGLLEADGFTVHIPETVPANDAGLSYGQVIEYGMVLKP
ncbi:MAG: carbamoyltransferase HypF [Pseudomonadota bacterium]